MVMKYKFFTIKKFIIVCMNYLNPNENFFNNWYFTIKQSDFLSLEGCRDCDETRKSQCFTLKSYLVINFLAEKEFNQYKYYYYFHIELYYFKETSKINKQLQNFSDWILIVVLKLRCKQKCFADVFIISFMFQITFTF